MKNEFIRVRVSEEEKEIITDKALSSYRILSQYIRDCALQKEIIVIDGLKEIDSDLRRIGNNLNQLTALANQGSINCINLDEMKNEVNKIWQSVNSCLQKAM